jgi:hypothetical protein
LKRQWPVSGFCSGFRTGPELAVAEKKCNTPDRYQTVEENHDFIHEVRFGFRLSVAVF